MRRRSTKESFHAEKCDSETSPFHRSINRSAIPLPRLPRRKAVTHAVNTVADSRFNQRFTVRTATARRAFSCTVPCDHCTYARPTDRRDHLLNTRCAATLRARRDRLPPPLTVVPPPPPRPGEQHHREYGLGGSHRVLQLHGHPGEGRRRSSSPWPTRRAISRSGTSTRSCLL